MRKLLILIFFSMPILASAQETDTDEITQKSEFICTPCGCEGDHKIYDSPGVCEVCNMTLIDKNNPSVGIAYTNIYNAELCTMLKDNPDLILLDVRSVREYTDGDSELGRFPNAINIPITEIENRIEELSRYKEKDILVYCSISARSPRVSALLADNGFNHIYNLMGGLSQWQKTDVKDLPCKEIIEKGF